MRYRRLTFVLFKRCWDVSQVNIYKHKLYFSFFEQRRTIENDDEKNEGYSLKISTKFYLQNETMSGICCVLGCGDAGE